MYALSDLVVLLLLELELFHILDEGLFVDLQVSLVQIRHTERGETYQASVLAISQDANISQTQLDKALVHQVHGRVNIERNRSRVDVWREVTRIVLRVLAVIARRLRLPTSCPVNLR